MSSMTLTQNDLSSVDMDLHFRDGSDVKIQWQSPNGKPKHHHVRTYQTGGQDGLNGSNTTADNDFGDMQAVLLDTLEQMLESMQNSMADSTKFDENNGNQQTTGHHRHHRGKHHHQSSSTTTNQTTTSQNQGSDTWRNGATINANYFPSGQCTWGAQNLFNQATGSYLNVSGNADQWADQAKQAGWTVDKTPSPQSIAVFPDNVEGASSKYGHVAYVVKVNKDGSYVIREMNNSVLGGNGIYNDRTVPADSRVSFIHIPTSMIKQPISEGPTVAA
ncbi:CHAP domain-containing protein [Trinickia sp. LjRoot230]|uniref:CHAP domain-containing protein n=1 Tax=Trinickia sp. LjRoot230 TaxID=3342288 RepID=UPI003ED16A09